MHTGTNAHFIRLAGCDVGCPWCDTKHSWDVNAHPHRAIDEVAVGAFASAAEIVIITGGEPLMHDLRGLCDALQGLPRHIETSGAYPLSGTWEWVCLSPKKFAAVQPSCYAAAHELKVIVCNAHDLIFAQEQATYVNKACALVLQPEWSRTEKNAALLHDFVQQHPEWRLSWQLHKYLSVS